MSVYAHTQNKLYLSILSALNTDSFISYLLFCFSYIIILYCDGNHSNVIYTSEIESEEEWYEKWIKMRWNGNIR